MHKKVEKQMEANKELKRQMEARKMLIEREKAIELAKVESLEAVESDFHRAIDLEQKSMITAGRKGAWLLACQIVRLSLTLDEAISDLRKSLAKKQREDESKGKTFDRPLTGQIENYRTLVPHALYLREIQITKGRFEEGDDKFPTKAKWHTVGHYRLLFKAMGLSSGEAVGRWQEADSFYESNVLAPVRRDAEKDGTPKSAILKSTFQKQLRNLAKAQDEKQGKGCVKLTPEEVALSLLKKDETCLSLLSLCGEGVLKHIERIIAQVRRNREQASS